METPITYKPWVQERDAELPFVADDLLPEVKCTITSASATSGGRLAVTIVEESRAEPLDLEFPGEYLRFNCECSHCFIQSSHSHSAPFELMLQPASIESVSFKNNEVTVIFTNSHESCFSAVWLYNRRMTTEGANERLDSIYFHGQEPWADGDDFKIQSASLSEVCGSPEGFVTFGEALIRDGLYLITDCSDKNILPKEFEVMSGLYCFSTHYGERFDVINHPNPVNMGYTPKKLGLHVDLPMLVRCPRVQMLHCMQPSDEGGESIVTDGMKAAGILRERHPEMYQLLITQNIEMEDIFPLSTNQVLHESYYANSSPIVVLDNVGKPVYLQWTIADRSSYFNGSPDEFEKWMEAIKTFYKYLLEGSRKLKIQSGQMLVFDNTRVMHGRESFNPNHPRQLEGSYTDWDHVYSRLRAARMLISCRKRHSQEQS